MALRWLWGGFEMAWVSFQFIVSKDTQNNLGVFQSKPLIPDVVLTYVVNMTFEINDRVRGARKNITLPSFSSWDTLKDKAAEVLNVEIGRAHV